MTFIECKVELRRTDGRVLATSMSLQVRPVVDQPINVPVCPEPLAGRLGAPAQRSRLL
jgi:hypothetical protein